jgi:hypothetical protein
MVATAEMVGMGAVDRTPALRRMACRADVGSVGKPIALLRWRLAVWLVEKLAYREINQIGPLVECSMIARRHNNQLSTL